MKRNSDEVLLLNKKIDNTLDQPIIHQALRIAVYDEFRAYETYCEMVEKHGAIEPFNKILESEQAHYSALITLLERYEVEVPVNDWYEKIDVPDTIVECFEVGVAAEIENIAMYNHLLEYTDEEDVREVLYKLQAASYNCHLPLFRQAVASSYSFNEQSSPLGLETGENVMDKLGEYQEVFESAMQGNVDQAKIAQLFQNSNMAMLSGLALGGLGTVIVKDMLNKKTEEEI